MFFINSMSFTEILILAKDQTKSITYLRTKFMKQAKDKNQIIYIILDQLSPMKDSLVYSELGCKECCILPHGTRRHKEIPTKKLKNQIDQFTGLDDWLWEDAIGVQHKLQLLELNIRKLREQTMQKIYDKKLSYALAWDKADDIEKSFKLARDGEWRKLTCTNIFRIQEKMQRGRKIQENDVKKLTWQIVEQAQKSVEALVKSCFNNNNSRTYEDRREYRREQERPRRQERARMDPFNNDYPLVKINKVTEIDTHFNIVLKVIKLHKQFRINGSNKLQILCGDETGTAVAVIDYYSFVKVGIVISISNARIYSFHGSKQIQCSNRNSQVKQERIIINQVNQKYSLSGGARRGNNNNDDRRPRRREDVEKRIPREERERQDRPRRGGRQNRDVRPYRVDRNAVTYKEQQQKPARRERERERGEPVRTERKYQRKQQQKPARILREDRSQVRYGVDRENPPNNRKYQSSSSSSQDEGEQQEPKIQKSASFQKQNNIKFTKIHNIEPGDEELTIIAEIYELQIQGPTPQKGHFLSHIGDETGIIRIQLPKSNPAIKEGAVIKIVNVDADVDPRDHRLTLKLDDDGFCDKTDIKMPKLKIDNNMSTNQWESDEEEELNDAIIEDL